MRRKKGLPRPAGPGRGSWGSVSLGWAAFLGEHGLDDFAALRLRETALAQEVGAVFIAAGDDPFACGADALDEGLWRGVRKTRQRRCRLMREAGGGVFGMPDADLLKVFDAPEIAVLADSPEIEAGDAQRFRADLRVPAVEASEEQIGRAVWQRSGFDRVQIVDQEEEDVAV